MGGHAAGSARNSVYASSAAVHLLDVLFFLTAGLVSLGCLFSERLPCGGALYAAPLGLLVFRLILDRRVAIWLPMVVIGLLVDLVAGAALTEAAFIKLKPSLLNFWIAAAVLTATLFGHSPAKFFLVGFVEYSDRGWRVIDVGAIVLFALLGLMNLVALVAANTEGWLWIKTFMVPLLYWVGAGVLLFGIGRRWSLTRRPPKMGSGRDLSAIVSRDRWSLLPIWINVYGAALISSAVVAYVLLSEREARWLDALPLNGASLGAGSALIVCSAAFVWATGGKGHAVYAAVFAWWQVILGVFLLAAGGLLGHRAGSPAAIDLSIAMMALGCAALCYGGLALTFLRPAEAFFADTDAALRRRGDLTPPRRSALWPLLLFGGGLILIAAKPTIVAAPQLINQAPPGEAPLLGLTAGLFVGAGLPLLGIYALAVGRALRHQPELGTKSGSGSVLFLRPFESDLFKIDLLWPSFETWLSIVLAPSASLIAIKNPRVYDPQGGVFEPQADDQWRAEVEARIRNAPMIVLTLGKSPGVAWEIGRLIALGALEKSVFCVPVLDQRDPNTAAAEWEALVAAFSDAKARAALQRIEQPETLRAFAFRRDGSVALTRSATGTTRARVLSALGTLADLDR